jgi:thymidine phosphorylase
MALAARMLRLAGRADGEAAARGLLQHALSSGAARERLALMIEAQGGDRAYIDEPERLPQAPHRRNVLARASGVITAIDTLGLGLLARDLGAGRRVKTDTIDYRVGVLLHAHVGDVIEAGQPLATIYAAEPVAAARAVADLARLYTVGVEPPPPTPLIVGEVAAGA